MFIKQQLINTKTSRGQLFYRWPRLVFLIVFSLLTTGCHAALQEEPNITIDKNTAATFRVEKAEKADAPTPRNVRVKVLPIVKPKSETHIVQVILSTNEIDLSNDKFLELDTPKSYIIGNISYYPPAKENNPVEAVFTLPDELLNSGPPYYLSFRMIPVHPEGQLNKSVTQILSYEFIE